MILHKNSLFCSINAKIIEVKFNYKTLRRDKAEDQLRDIIYYIAADSGSIHRYSILKKQGYRVVVVGSHLVFYKIDEDNKVVIVYAIVDGRIQ